MPQDQILEIWGEFACFTRPELKVERFSYPIITPSAARGIYDAIYCKPDEFRWQVTQIEVLTPPRYIALKRNEVKEKVPSPVTIMRWIKGEIDIKPILADDNAPKDDTKGRTQRQTIALKDVQYRLHAYIHPWPGFESRLPAFEAQFRRRASQGKCVYQPYLGCREFPAFFEFVIPNEGHKQALSDLNLDIGLMLYDVFDLSAPGKPLDSSKNESPSISLFRAKVEKGILVVPAYDSEVVLKGVK
ncbi:MAG: type I-C CRISPR-associated protein Cas5c [Dehalococcoidales bacterium]|nr:type I-C CRISPR-associated protein Cas5c [Dehalococcoidales bacterium]MDX9803887.1 type I-C CRISPR-associated protein Cas5c [Dehalococcoidales bacterium]